MLKNIKDQKEISDDKPIASILSKFDITELNPMQEKAGETIKSKSDVILLSPTGTGKTVCLLSLILSFIKQK